MSLSDAEVQALSQNLETTQSELASTKKALDTATAQLKERDAAFKPLETELAAAKTKLADLSGQVTVLTGNNAAQGKELAAQKEALTGAISSFKSVVISANPGIPGELITGENIPDITASLQKAQTIVTKVNASLQANIKASAIPAGAPPRGKSDLSALSPREKIARE